MRGSTPLDVAASSVMDNNSLALALEEPDLEKVMCMTKYDIMCMNRKEYILILVLVVLLPVHKCLYMVPYHEDYSCF